MPIIAGRDAKNDYHCSKPTPRLPSFIPPQAVTQYFEKVAGGYTSGLPTFKVDKSALAMPRRLDERVDLEVRHRTV